MYLVYLIRSIILSDKTYTGFTRNIKKRLLKHNEGGSYHTAKFKPWKLEFYVAFKDKELAIDFERYLKSSSGKAFTSKHFVLKKETQLGITTGHDTSEL